MSYINSFLVFVHNIYYIERNYYSPSGICGIWNVALLANLRCKDSNQGMTVGSERILWNPSIRDDFGKLIRSSKGFSHCRRSNKGYRMLEAVYVKPTYSMESWVDGL